MKILAATVTGMAVDTFRDEVAEWLARRTIALEPALHRPRLPAQIELMAYLRTNGYKTYIVTGGGQDFVRVYAERILRYSARAGGRQRRCRRLQ